LTKENSPAGATLPARKKGRERRQLIVDTARDILKTSGISGLVLRDVADQLDITHGNLQYYFPTKEDLLVAIFDQELLKYTTTLHEASKRTSSRQGRVAAIVDSGFSQLRSDSTPLWRMLISLADQSPALADILRQVNKRYDQELADELASIAPEMPAQRRHHIAQMFRLLLDGLGAQLSWDDANSADMRALESELKATMTSWILGSD
jgi:AcrR family transcriptional regulator